MLPRGSVDGGPAPTLSRRDAPFDLLNYRKFFTWASENLIKLTHLEKLGTAAMDSLLLRPNSVGGTFEIVTTECRRPPGCGAGACDKVARNACSMGDGPEPSPPRSDNLLTWLAVMPLVQGGVGRECLRVSRGSRHGDSRYGFIDGESISKLCRGDDDFLLSTSSFSSCSDSSTTISGSWLLAPNGENDERRSFARVSVIEFL